MIESSTRKKDETMFKEKAIESINRMLDCMLTNDDKTCKNCSDVSICSFLTEAVFTYRQQYSL